MAKSKFITTMGKKLDLKKEQEKTLTTPKLRANLILKILFFTFDLLYGFKRSLPKVKVLELLARYPYWAWENGGYGRLTRLYARATKANEARTRLYLDYIEWGRSAQDNEQWHLLLLEDLIQQKGIKLGWFRHWLAPRLLALGYYWLTSLMFFARPQWSFYMNAAFESHAEHEYMAFAAEHPEFDREKVFSHWFKYYPKQITIGNLIRRIALDERDHMYHSLEAMERLKAQKRPTS